MRAPAEYLARAADALEMARRAVTPEGRADFLAIAESWRDLAIVSARRHNLPLPEDPEGGEES